MKKRLCVFCLGLCLMMGLLWTVPADPAGAETTGLDAYPVSHHRYTLVDARGQDTIGMLITGLAQQGLGGAYYQTIQYMEWQGRYDETLRWIKKRPVPNLPNIPIDVHACYQKVLEAKWSQNQVAVDMTILDHLGALLLESARGARDYRGLELVRELEVKEDYGEAADLLKTRFGQENDALLLAYRAILEKKAGSFEAAVQDIENAIAMVPANRMFYTWAADIYRAAGIDRLEIFIDGKKQDFKPAPTAEKGTLVVPARPLAEVVGATAEWDAGSNAVTLSRDGKTVKMTIGSRMGLIDGKAYDMGVVPTIAGGSAMIPLGFTGEALGAEVIFDTANGLVRVASRKNQ